MPKSSKSHLDPARTTPIGMVRYAIEFYACAKAADDAIGDEDGYEIAAPMPVNYLVGHAIELGLKAYLLQQGASLRDLKHKLGHDLVICLAAAETAGLGQSLDIFDEDRRVLGTLNELYVDKQLQYFERGMKTFPVFGPLDDFAKRLLNAVVDFIPDAHILRRQKAGRSL